MLRLMNVNKNDKYIRDKIYLNSCASLLHKKSKVQVSDTTEVDRSNSVRQKKKKNLKQNG